jgi:SAM-dependent methyltransferase
MSPTWDEIWERRTLDPAAGSTLAQLMAADGLDTGFGSVAEEHWRAGVRRAAEELRLEPGDSVYEVGCGAGAFLYDLYERGFAVGGLDRSGALVGYAQEAMPDGSFAVGDAAEVPPAPQADAVVSCGVFLYFPSLDYADGVLAAMAAKAQRAVGLFDLPDAARRTDAVARRVEVAGGPKAYAERYAGLDHLYFDRDRIAASLRALGLTDVCVADQWVSGYENAAYRFNAWGFLPGYV